MFELTDDFSENAVIKVIGVGGGGGNAIQHMVESGIEGVDFIAANTDAQALKNASARNVLQLGNEFTKGLGAGANPDVGRQSALEDRDRIQEMLLGTDMLFITAGMGGGTGTGAAPVVAEIAREMGILTVAVVTKPFPFEGRKRSMVANTGIENLNKVVDSLITIPNEKLLKVLGKDVSLLDAFKAANDVLLGAVQGIAELITRPGLINVDFADVKTVMSEMGLAMMGTGAATGENRAKNAAIAAISSPLLDNINLAGAKGVLVNITAGLDISIAEFEAVGDAIREFTSDDATVIVGTVIDPGMQNELRVTLVATGLKSEDESTSHSNTIRQQIIVNALQNHDNHDLNAAAAATANQSVNNEQEQLAIATETSEPVTNYEGSTAQFSHKLENFNYSEHNMDYLDIPAFLRKQES